MSNILRNAIKEEWRDIEGFNGKYQVSNKGHIVSLDRYVNNMFNTSSKIKGKTLKLGKGTTGYLGTVLYDNGIRKNIEIHRLLATIFIPNPENLPCVNHKDGDKLNNSLENLEWCTHSYNARHAHAMGLSRPAKGGEHKMSKLDEASVILIKTELRKGLKKQKELAGEFDVNPSTISNIHRGLTWKHVKVKPAEILCNKILTPDGTILESNHRWDYKEQEDRYEH